MPDVLLSETCVCGSDHWHAMMGRVLWCRRCGCLRLASHQYWRVPLDRAGDLSATAVAVDEDEEPTRPGTPDAKKTPGSSGPWGEMGLAASSELVESI